jgi:hypothetical protein
MGPPLPLRSAGEGKLGGKTDVIYSSDLTAAAMESGEGSTLSSSGGL